MFFLGCSKKTASEGLIRGLANELIDGGVISLKYDDDTILFADSKVEYARTFKWI
jgi:hypothetical protein